ncbi:hypothetical protein D3Y57_07780 [Sphingomonas paeninsulae]|jgi:maleate isomerase|uniref:Maleate isomerase n=1 Tax=Sphingomonas paeninsulae TaxID=2319844 RepID=A0A494TJE1_SPHPE|nr:hypothetical protein [Sphingomonas paeninsulae]AYJ85891.1 hypothetical protein D3Y57_07780 [Sphingomonas paeninsulae]
MTIGRYDYGRAGRIGIGTPQANPTVEAEFAILTPPSVSMAVIRLTSSHTDPADRLRSYLERLEDHLAAYDTYRPDVFGFACTASSYLVSQVDQHRIVAACEQRFGYPIVTAADAIQWALERIGARRIALLSPYPPALSQAAHAFWQGRGFELIETGNAGGLGAGADTRGIYAMGSIDAANALARIDIAGIDAVLFSGTGMPSLPLIAEHRTGPPLLSSNLCLAACLFDQLGLRNLLDPDSAPELSWRDRCRAATTQF